MRKGNFVLILTAVLMACGVGAQADVLVSTVPVGNAGNAGEVSGTLYSGVTDRICGAVDYSYRIGKFEITAGQYTEFLNATAKSDPYELYCVFMDIDATINKQGCNIKRNGTSGNYSYTVASDWANRPVNYVSWGDAARFANWMHNGQGNGDTETGSYNLNGAMSNGELVGVNREPGATWVIPTEDEWYKAAYHKNNGATSDYYDYPSGSNSPPSNDLDGGGNNGTFYDGGYTIGSSYYRTEVGAHVNSESPYGTFDQGGNVWEWNETMLQYGGSGGSDMYGLRGGAYNSQSSRLHANYREYEYVWPSADTEMVGFRLALVPEPASLPLLALGGLAVLRRR